MSASIHLRDKKFVPFISGNEIESRVKELATEIKTRYRDHNPFFIAILNGAFVFAADLLKNLSIDCGITFVKIKSYQGTQSTGHFNQMIGLEEPIGGRHVIVLEDIVDTGRTLAGLLPELLSHKPLSLAVVTLVSKTEAREVKVKVDHIGFEIPNKFIVGYGLDYNGLGRNLPALYQVVD